MTFEIMIRLLERTYQLCVVATVFRFSASGWSTQAMCEHGLPQRRGNHVVHHGRRKLLHTVNF